MECQIGGDIKVDNAMRLLDSSSSDQNSSLECDRNSSRESDQNSSRESDKNSSRESDQNSTRESDQSSSAIYCESCGFEAQTSIELRQHTIKNHKKSKFVPLRESPRKGDAPTRTSRREKKTTRTSYNIYSDSVLDDILQD